MGYSCTKKADEVLDQIMQRLIWSGYGDFVDGKPSQNSWRINGRCFFFEIGKENEDGAITGSVWESYPNTCYRRGSFKISWDGKVIRFPYVPKRVLIEDVCMLKRRF